MISDETAGRSVSKASRLNDSISDFAGEATTANASGTDPVESSLGALALFGTEATEDSDQIANTVATSATERRDGVAESVHDSVRAIRSRLTRTPAALTSTVPASLSAVRSFIVSRFRAFVVQHPKLPLSVGLIACILVTGIIARHFVGAIPSLTLHSAEPSPTASVAPTAKPITTPAISQATRPAARKNTEPARSRNRADANNGRSPDRSVRAAVAQTKKADPQVHRVNAERDDRVPLRAPFADQAAGERVPPLALSPSRVPASVPGKPELPPPPVVAALESTPVAAYDNTASIYSARDSDVRPPQMLAADLPRPAVATWPTITNSVELVINQDGGVDRVKWLTNRERMPDVMMLSRAKMWKFSPALRDGEPVKYRLVLSWEVNP